MQGDWKAPLITEVWRGWWGKKVLEFIWISKNSSLPLESLNTSKVYKIWHCLYKNIIWKSDVYVQSTKENCYKLNMIRATSSTHHRKRGFFLLDFLGQKKGEYFNLKSVMKAGSVITTSWMSYLEICRLLVLEWLNKCATANAAERFEVLEL